MYNYTSLISPALSRARSLSLCIFLSCHSLQTGLAKNEGKR